MSRSHKLHLVIGNKRYSSWSMRPWLVLTAFDIPFEETVIPLKRADTAVRIAEFSPSGKVPVLIDVDTRVWESLAVIEYLAERFPTRAIWPRDTAARAHARAISSEMHAGFQALRQTCNMNLGKRFAPAGFGPDVAMNVSRLTSIWKQARQLFGGDSPFLYGEFSAADAMFAPVVTRLETYAIRVDDGARDYMAAITSHPAFVAWRDAGLMEPWMIPEYESNHAAVIQDLNRPHTVDRFNALT